MSRRYRRRPQHGVPERRDVRRQAFLILLKGIYQATKRMEATHWLAATEKSLQRLVEQYGFPFRVIGPEANYGGPVAPYLMNWRSSMTSSCPVRLRRSKSFPSVWSPSFSRIVGPPAAVATSSCRRH